MPAPDGGPTRIELDHERRLLRLEQGLGDLERKVNAMEPQLDEVLLARRVTAGVTAALDQRETAGLNRWQKAGIIVGIAGGALAGVLEIGVLIAKAVGHG